MISLLLVLPALLLSQACTEPSKPLELSVNPIPGELDTNVPKISGKVSDASATVYINNGKAMVFEEGTFFAYIEIPPRVSTMIEVRAQSSGQSTSKSFITTFYPTPFIWIFAGLHGLDTYSEPAIMKGWVSYPDARIEITGDLRDPVVEIQEDGFFTATFNLFKGQNPASDTTYDIKVRANTPRGTTGYDIKRMKKVGERPPIIPTNEPPFPLNDTPPTTRIVHAEKGKTVTLDRKFYFDVTTPSTIDLELVPDPKSGPISEHLTVSIEPRSFLGYPVAPRNSTIIIKADDKVPSGNYFFRANRGDHIEVVVE